MRLRLASILLTAVIAGSSFALGACSNQPVLYSASNYQPSAGDLPVRTTVGQGGGQAATPARIAVTHRFTLRMPSADIEAVQRQHLDECARLGCTVLSTHIDHVNAGRTSASSSVRISPDGFAELAKSLARPPAELVSHSQSSDDKTVPLTDVEKRLEVKTALRDRLNAMLKDPNTKTTADLLAIEKELTQVQGEIEAAVAQRDYLRTITETVRIDISYVGATPLTAGIDFYPLRQAASASGQTMASSAATLVTFLAAALPWLPLVALLGWGVRRLFRRRKAAAA
jgi:hypothetical protein